MDDFEVDEGKNEDDDLKTVYNKHDNVNIGTTCYIQVVDLYWPQLLLATRNNQKRQKPNPGDRTSTPSRGHLMLVKIFQQGTWFIIQVETWEWSEFLGIQKTKHSSDEMLSHNIGKNKIGNLHSTEILSAMNYQTRATSYCWLWKLRDESLSNTPQ